jgi:hypothetical protein
VSETKKFMTMKLATHSDGEELRSDICRLQERLTVDVLLRKFNFVFCVCRSKTSRDAAISVYIFRVTTNLTNVFPLSTPHHSDVD